MSAALVLTIIVLATVAVIGAMLVAVRSPGWRGWLLLWLTIGCFGAGVIAPLWRLTHTRPEPTRALLDVRHRDVTLPAAPDAGTYRLEVRGAGSAPGSYALAVKRGDGTQTIRGRLDGESSIFAADLAEGEELRLFLARSDGPLAVTLTGPPGSAGWIWLLAVAAALLAVAADLYCATRRRRGLLTMAVAATSVFAIAAARIDEPGRGTVAGLALLALLAGAAFAVVAQLVAALAFRGLADERSPAKRRPRR